MSSQNCNTAVTVTTNAVNDSLSQNTSEKWYSFDNFSSYSFKISLKNYSLTNYVNSFEIFKGTCSGLTFLSKDSIGFIGDSLLATINVTLNDKIYIKVNASINYDSDSSLYKIILQQLFEPICFSVTNGFGFPTLGCCFPYEDDLSNIQCSNQNSSCYPSAPPYSICEVTVCEGAIINFTSCTPGNSNFVVNWYINGVPLSWATANSFSYTFNTPGLYVISYFSSSGSFSCPQITVLVLPSGTVANLTPASQNICVGQTASFSLVPSLPSGVADICFGDGTSAPFSTNTISHTYNQAGTYTVGFCNVNPNANCFDLSNTVVLNVIASPTITVTANPNSFCTNGTAPHSFLTANVSGANPASVQWSDGQTGQTVGVNAIPNNTFVANVSNSCGSTSAQITLNPINPPTVNLGTDVTLCQNINNPSPINYTVTVPNPQAGVNYTWQPGNFSATSFTLNVTSPSSSSYTVTATNSCGTALDIINISGIDPNCCSDDPNSYELANTPINSFSSTTPIFAGFPVYNPPPYKILIVDSVFTFDHDINVSNCIFIAKNLYSQIIIAKNADVVFSNCHFVGCTQMWQGIEAQQNSTLKIKANCLLEDALTGVRSINGAPVEIDESVFNRNLVHIELTSFQGTHPLSISRSRFTCRYGLPFPITASSLTYDYTGTLNVNYTKANLKSPHQLEYTETGILASNVFEVLIMPQVQRRNIFDYMHYGVHATNCNLNINRNDFQFIIGGIQCEKGGGCITNGVGIYAVTVAGNNSHCIVSTAPNQSNRFIDNYVGILAQGYYNINIRSNQFKSSAVPLGLFSPAISNAIGRTAISIGASDIGLYDIMNNSINNYQYGVFFDWQLGPNLQIANGVNINSNSFNSNGIFGSSTVTPRYMYNAIFVQSTSGASQNVNPRSIKVNGNNIQNVVIGIQGLYIKKGLEIKNNPIIKINNTGVANAYPAAGIRLTDCSDAFIEDNADISSVYTFWAAYNRNLQGIHLFRTQNTVVCNNVTHDLGEGLVFESLCTGVQATCNSMDKEHRGWVIRNGAIAGPAPHGGGGPSNNVWGLPTNFTQAQTYADGAIAGLNRINIDPINTPIVNLVSTATGSFAYIFGTSLITASGNSSCACNGGGGNGGGNNLKLSFYENSVQNNLSISNFNPHPDWLNKKNIFIDIDKNGDMGSTILQNFHAQENNGNFAKLMHYQNSIEAGNHNFAQAENFSLNENYHFETTLKNLQNIQLNFLINNQIIPLNATDEDSVIKYMSFCPLECGEAVSLARAIYNSKFQLFPDTINNCTINSNRNSQLENLNPIINEKSNLYRIYPNPSSANSFIIIEGDNICSIEVINIKGEKLITTRYNSLNKVNLSTEFIPGLYFIKIINEKGNVSLQKIILE